MLRFVVLIVIATLLSSAVLAQQDTNDIGKLVTIELNNTSVTEALDTLFKGSGFDYKIDTAVSGVVSLSLKNTPFETALSAILSAANPPLSFSKTGNTYNITRKTETEGTPSAPVVVKPEEAPPTITPNLDIVKRTPTIDGQIEPGEWDLLFKFSYGGVNARTYANWDNDNLYIASEASEPVDLLVTIDAKNDSWFHGDDNYELMARREQDSEGASLSVSRYESRGASSTSGVPLTSGEASAFTMKASQASGSCVYEIAIPRKAIPGLQLKPGAKLGIKVAVGIGSPDVQWIPAAALGEVQTAELVTSKTSSTEKLSIRCDLQDSRLVPGQELVAKVTIKNQGVTTSNADSIVIGGEGKTSKILNSQLIRFRGIEAGKSYSTTFRSPIFASSGIGSQALGVEVRSGESPVATGLFSFDVVPKYEVRMATEEKPLKGGFYYQITVIVKNNTPNQIYGTVEISAPDGWTARKSKLAKAFKITQEDAEQDIVFRLDPPSNAQGQATFAAEIRIGSDVIKDSRTVNISTK